MKKDPKKILENLKLPEMTSPTAHEQFRSYLLNTRRSGVIGLLLLVLPFFFVLSNVLEYILKVNPGIFRKVVDLFAYLDQYPGLWFLGPLILLGGPMLAVLLNVLSILHVHYEKGSKELMLSLKMKWLNILIVLICALIIGILMLYLLVENAS